MHAGKLLLKGQTNFIKMLWKFNKVYNAARQCADHRRPVRYEMRPPVPRNGDRPGAAQLYVHRAKQPAAASRPEGGHVAFEAK
jgi:magnesium-protoporphyrin IX monomethyl ester (oxidative) cyclase